MFKIMTHAIYTSNRMFSFYCLLQMAALVVSLINLIVAPTVWTSMLINSENKFSLLAYKSLWKMSF